MKRSSKIAVGTVASLALGLAVYAAVAQPFGMGLGMSHGAEHGAAAGGHGPMAMRRGMMSHMGRMRHGDAQSGREAQ